jgi:DNA-binding NtrC family response regulator
MGIVFIDDEEAILSVLECLYENEYGDSKFFLKPEEAIEYIEKNIGDIDIIVSDYRMPTMDGIQVYEAVRKLSLSKPFIFYSAFIGDQLIRDVSKIKGSCVFVLKPGERELTRKIE